MPLDATLALALLPDFALILLGAGLRRILHLGDHFWNGLEKLVYYVLFPALLFGGLVKTRIDWSAAAPMIGVAAGAMATGMVLGLAARLLPISPLSFASQYQCAFRFNSYIGLAVAGTLYGVPGIAAMGIVIGLMVPPANIAAVWVLARHGEAGVWRELVRNPLILATLAGVAANLVGLTLPTMFQQFLSRLAEAAIVLGLLAVGAGLRIVSAGGTATHAAAAYLLVVKLAAMPAMALLLVRFARNPRRHRAGFCGVADGKFGLYSCPAHGRRWCASRLADFCRHLGRHAEFAGLAGVALTYLPLPSPFGVA
jgi:predicted permease